MASNPRPLSLRLGLDGHRALDMISRCRGITRAEAARQAIAETADRERRRSRLVEEAAEMRDDPEYLAEARDVLALMEELRGSR